ncbi:hypothetical protein JHK85_003843 [Glycine max]|nr:hypothetical protein JHK85_003843 [Glycine max]KAG5079613.1 hypothetical protein JHK86_003678 [Glycine max]
MSPKRSTISLSLTLSSLDLASLTLDSKLQRMLLSVGFCASKLTPMPRLISMMGNSMAFMDPKLHSFLQMRMGYGKVLIHNNSQLASTYCAISILKIFGCELSNLDSETIVTSMRNLQQPDGSFIPIHTGGQTDLRFVYCAGQSIAASKRHSDNQCLS